MTRPQFVLFSLGLSLGIAGGFFTAEEQQQGVLIPAEMPEGSSAPTLLVGAAEAPSNDSAPQTSGHVDEPINGGLAVLHSSSDRSHFRSLGIAFAQAKRGEEFVRLHGPRPLLPIGLTVDEYRRSSAQRMIFDWPARVNERHARLNESLWKEEEVRSFGFVAWHFEGLAQTIVGRRPGRLAPHALAASWAGGVAQLRALPAETQRSLIDLARRRYQSEREQFAVIWREMQVAGTRTLNDSGVVASDEKGVLHFIDAHSDADLGALLQKLTEVRRSVRQSISETIPK